MAIETPAYWETDPQLQEKVQETTAYGNPIMIPKQYLGGWEMARLTQKYCEERGLDPVESFRGMDTSRPKGYDTMMVYWERYRKPI